MDPIIASHSQLLAVNTFLVHKALDALTEEEIWRRPSDHTNSIGWMLGHMVWSRLGLTRMLGGENVQVPGGKIFDRGVQLGDRSAYPATQEIVAAYKAVNDQLKTRMETIADAELSAKAPRDFPIPDKSLRGAVAFMTFHDSYHVGQMALVVKWLGKAGLVG